MQCIVCQSNVVGFEILALRTRLQKGFIVCHKSNGITIMEKHVELEHNTLIKKFHKKQFDVVTIISLSCEPTKKQAHVTPSAIFGFFSFTNQFKKNETQVCFLEDVMLFVIKGYLPMSIVESIWL
jgi:hypothetical protein